MTAARELSLDDIEALAVGAWILGTGGGGSPYLGLLNMRRLYAEGHRVALMPPDALADDDWVAAVSNMGAPLVGQERLTDSRTIARAVALMEEHRGVALPRRHGARDRRRQLDPAADGGGASQEAGGRCRHDGPRLSRGADDLGRGRRPAPVPADDGRLPRPRVDRRQGAELEMDGAGQPQDLRRVRLDRLDLQGAAHRPRGQGLGRSTARPRRRSRSATRCARRRRATATRSRRSCRSSPARCCSAARSSTSSAARPRASCAARRAVAGIDDDRGSSVVLDFQNEWIVAWRDGEPIATSPDLICVLDSVAGEAVGTETIRYGQRVTVIALPPPAVFPTPKGLQHVGPRAFGYDIDYRPVFAHEAHRHRRRRHQHGRGADRGGQRARRRQGADHARRDRRHPRRARAACTATGAVGDKPVDAVMIGTTHFINAVVQRRCLSRVGAIRIGLPASASLPPFCDWPQDLAAVVDGRRRDGRRRA